MNLGGRDSTESSKSERISSESERISVLAGVESPILSEIGSRSGADSNTKPVEGIDAVVEAKGEVGAAPWLTSQMKVPSSSDIDTMEPNLNIVPGGGGWFSSSEKVTPPRFGDDAIAVDC